MEGLRKENLAEGNVYWCLLSSRPILVSKKTEVESEGIEVSGVVFDPDLNKYMKILVADGQLCGYRITKLGYGDFNPNQP